MASATYWQRGEALDYVNNTSNMIKVGTVLKIGTRIGIAGDDIAPKATGAIHVSGVYDFNTLAGYAAEDSPSTATVIKVKIG